MPIGKPGSRVGAAMVATVGAAMILSSPATGVAFAQAKPVGTKVPPLGRSSLAKSASFVVTLTLAPKGSAPLVRKFSVEVDGAKARLEYGDDALGNVIYLANDKGVFFYIPANKVAQKQAMAGGIDGALKLAFAQVVEQMSGAVKTGTGNVSGQPTDIYKNPKTGTVIHWGRNPGFALPVKMELKNEGGAQSLLASSIKVGVKISGARFSLPSGTQILESQGTPSGLPGLR